MKHNSRKTRKAIAILSSPKFFWAVMGLFLLQAAWIAISGRFPMAFDEDFHLGIIRLYAHHISPFWKAQPAGPATYGAVTRDPSYLYQYLMSFVYRLITLFTQDTTIIVLWLRAISIGLFAWGLILYRKLLLKTKASPAIVNACLLLFSLIPIVPLLAAQINYDNLLFPTLALILLIAWKFDEELTRYKRINAASLCQLVSLCLLASLIKYAFLPIFVALVLFFGLSFYRVYHSWRKFALSLAFGVTLISRSTRWLYLASILISLGLFSQRYVVNIAKYHTPIPSCNQVLNDTQCSAYGPWIRDYNYSIANIDGPRSPLTFSNDWFYGMWLRTFFAVDGPGTHFQTKGPLLIPSLDGIVITVVGSAASVLAYRKVMKRYNWRLLSLLLVVDISYIAALWLDDYKAFLSTGQPVAINGRYLLQALLPLMLFSVLAVKELLARNAKLMWLVGSVTILAMAWGGGALTYILRSNNAWYWPNHSVDVVNNGVQRYVGPLVPGDKDPNAFLR